MASKSPVKRRLYITGGLTGLAVSVERNGVDGPFYKPKSASRHRLQRLTLKLNAPFVSLNGESIGLFYDAPKPSPQPSPKGRGGKKRGGPKW